MFRLILILFGAALIGCSQRQFSASEIDHIKFNVQYRNPVNHGSKVVLDVYAVMEGGKTHRLDGDTSLKIASEEIYEYYNIGFLIDQPCPSFRDTFFNISFTYSDTSGTFYQEDSLKLDYKAPLKVYAPIVPRKNGKDQRKRSSTLFGRDGVDGEKGGAGGNGKNGLHCTGYVWEEQGQLRLRLEIDSLNEVWCYKSFVTDTLSINLSGSPGGKGGKGGDGGDGKHASDTKSAGSGGNGGDGGNGGNGGNGGSLLLFVHPNIQELKGHIAVYNSGALGGSPGAGGTGGIAGETKDPTQPDTAQNGTPGNPGESGTNGKDGPKPVIMVSTFDFEKFD